MKFSKVLSAGLCAISLQLSAASPQLQGTFTTSNDPSYGIAVRGTSGFISTVFQTDQFNTYPYFNTFNAQTSQSTGSYTALKAIPYSSLSTSGGVIYALSTAEQKDGNGIIYSLDTALSPSTQIAYTGIISRNVLINGTTGYISGQPWILKRKKKAEVSGIIGVFDINDMVPLEATPVEISNINYVEGNPEGMAVNGTTLYAADGTGYVLMYDTTANPIALSGSFTTDASKPQDVKISGNTLFVTGAEGIYYYDLSNNNQFMGSISLDGAKNMAIYNNTTGYVTTFQQDLNKNYIVGYFSTGTAPTPAPLPVITGGGNSSSVASMLNGINGNCPADTQGIIDYLSTLPENEQIANMNQLAPAFKILQFTLEKLDLLLQKELDDSLYGRQKGNVPFVLAGYNNLTQLKVKPYNGYTSNDCYQMLGMTGTFEKARWMAGAGASESWMSVTPQHARASYNTVWGTLGFSKMHHRYQVGIKGLFGYSFIDAYRKITFLNEKAKTDHGAYNISVDGRFSAVYRYGKTQVTPYDNIGYIYGYENKYKEHGAPGADLIITNEEISMLRNSLGLTLDTVAYKHVKFFLDGAWVYEHNFKSTKYKGYFVGTDVPGIFNQPDQTSNFGRAQLGFMNDRDDFTWRLCYTGLFGKKFYDNAISLKLAYKF